jgi:hypothetical protein
MPIWARATGYRAIHALATSAPSAGYGVSNAATTWLNMESDALGVEIMPQSWRRGSVQPACGH